RDLVIDQFAEFRARFGPALGLERTPIAETVKRAVAGLGRVGSRMHGLLLSFSVHARPFAGAARAAELDTLSAVFGAAMSATWASQASSARRFSASLSYRS